MKMHEEQQVFDKVAARQRVQALEDQCHERQQDDQGNRDIVEQ